MKLREWVWVPTLIAAGILLPGLTAPSADAMPPEDAYIATLDYFGIYYSSEPAAIEAGYASCNALDSGMSPAAVVRIGQTAGGYSRIDAERIVGAAIGALCPRHMGLVAARPQPASMGGRVI